MPAYLVIDSIVHDPETYGQYTTAVRPIIQAYGGKTLVSSDKVTPLSGGWEPKRVAIIRFSDAATLKDCFASEEYMAIKHLRDNSCSGKTVIVED